MNKEWHFRGIRQPSRQLCHWVRRSFSEKHQLSMQLPQLSKFFNSLRKKAHTFPLKNKNKNIYLGGTEA